MNSFKFFRMYWFNTNIFHTTIAPTICEAIVGVVKNLGVGGRVLGVGDRALNRACDQNNCQFTTRN